MDPKSLFIDERMRGLCANCGASDPDTQDHNPSKVFLDRPYPGNLPTVPMCRACNESYSSDELYLACMLECVITGFDSVDSIQRPNVRRILSKNETLRLNLFASRSLTAEGTPVFKVETNRIRNVLTKLARGHINYELSNVKSTDPDFLGFAPINQLSEEEFDSFFTIATPSLFPEIGSRQFMNMTFTKSSGFGGKGWSEWNVVQSNRYQYVVEQKQADSVKILLSNYLCCEIGWE